MQLYARRHFLFPPLNIEEYNDRVMAVVRCEAQVRQILSGCSFFFFFLFILYLKKKQENMVYLIVAAGCIAAKTSLQKLLVRRREVSWKLIEVMSLDRSFLHVARLLGSQQNNILKYV